MATRTLLTIPVALLALSLGPPARADLTLNLGGSSMTFVGTGTDADVTFGSFSITGSTGGDGDAAQSALMGTINGTYNYSTSGLSGTDQTANLTSLNTGGVPQLTIKDSNNQVLSIPIAGLNITTHVRSFFGHSFTAGGDLGTLQLGNATYNGTSTDLMALKNNVNREGGQIQLNFSFTGAESLTTLAKTSSSHTSYGGMVVGFTPEPSAMTLAALGALGLITYGLRRRAAAWS